jgi:hypothetical protein
MRSVRARRSRQASRARGRESCQHVLGDGERDRGLADTARSDYRHQALARESRDERRHSLLAANHPCYREREIVERRRRCRERRSRRWLGTAHRGDKIVAPSRNGDDVAIAILAVTEGTAQSADLNF